MTEAQAAALTNIGSVGCCIPRTTLQIHDGEIADVPTAKDMSISNSKNKRCKWRKGASLIRDSRTNPKWQ